MGVLLVAWLGYQLTSMYTAFFHFPTLIYRVQLWIPLAATGISLVAAFGGALNTMRNTMQLAPAEAMRPPSPTQFHRMLLKQLGLEKFLSPQLRMIIRTLERRPGNAELRRPLDANQHPQWMVFVVSEGRARLRKVSISRQGAGETMVTSSLQSGERVVMYPGDRRADGSRVTVR